MGFFKNLFNKDNTPDPNQQAQAEAFDRDWDSTLNRFKILIGAKDFKLDLTHPQTGAAMKPHEGLGGTFEDWQNIVSAWDQQRLLLETLLQMVGKSLNTWQFANMLVAIRKPDQALTLLKGEPPTPQDADDYSQYCAAYAYTFLYLQQADDALNWAKKAHDLTPNDSRIHTLLADAQYLTGAHDDANTIYSALMAKSDISDPASTNNVEAMYQSLFKLETGAVPSPMFAVEIGEKLSDPAQSEQFWQLTQVEFYASPYFRMQHAYHLLNQGHVDKAFAKLMALVQEMPWLREASINLNQIFKALDPDGNKIMPDFQQALRKTIADNNWTTDGMQSIKINTTIK